MRLAGLESAPCSLRLRLPLVSSHPSSSAAVRCGNHRQVGKWCRQQQQQQRMRREARKLWMVLFLGSRSQAHGSPFSTCSRMGKDDINFETRDATSLHHGVVIRDPNDLEKKKKAIRHAGLSKLQVIADFDMTLTKYMVNSERGQSSHALLHQGNAEYDLKRRQLFDHYYPIEISPTIPIDEKTKLMEEWWEKTHGLLIEGGLNYSAIVKSVQNAVIDFREGVVELFQLLESSDVPLLIFSAGLADIIEEVMRQKLHRTFGNIRIVSNRMHFDSAGNLLGFKGKTIHVLNKNEHALELAAPLHNNHNLGSNDAENGASFVQGRNNVLLLGDHVGDLGMSDGVDFENRISIGFLNENVENWLEIYKHAFDIVVLNDGSMSHVVDLVRECSF